MPDLSIADLFTLQADVWATRDACFAHYPHRCPTDCPGAGRHNADLAAQGLCECRSCNERSRAQRVEVWARALAGPYPGPNRLAIARVIADNVVRLQDEGIL